MRLKWKSNFDPNLKANSTTYSFLGTANEELTEKWMKKCRLELIHRVVPLLLMTPVNEREMETEKCCLLTDRD
jgi:hypothetical protein